MESIARNKATMAQIRELEDAPINPFTEKPRPQGHDNLLQARRKLPIHGHFDGILDVYHQHQVFILSGETGSGKSTQVPQMLVYDEYSSGLLVACTQPRRLAATELAGRVAHEMGVVLGEEAGYQIGGVRELDQNEKKSRLAYMTEGVLLGKHASDKDLSAYACIIVDEAHERTVETDILLAMLKRILRRRKDLKVYPCSGAVVPLPNLADFENCRSSSCQPLWMRSYSKSTLTIAR